MNASRRPSIHFTRSVVLVSLVIMAFTGCGGGSPSGPSTASPGVVLNGSLVGAAGSSSAGFGVSAQASKAISITGTVTVSVQESPGISTTVSSDGSFTLRGLPTGSFTLVFTRDGVPLGTLTFNSVMPNQEVTITVNITGSSVVLLEEQRNGVGHGDLEIEGRVEQVILLSATGDSRFIIDQRTVVARPGQTTIREGNTRRQASDLTVGQRVHVKGAWLPKEGATQPVLAYEIKLQHDDDDGEDGDDENPSATPTPTPRAACIIEGGVQGHKVELEGKILSGNAAAFRHMPEGSRSSSPVNVLAASASLECTPKSGPNAPTPAQCSASVTTGAKVHVSGILEICSATSAQVSASKVLVQK